MTDQEHLSETAEEHLVPIDLSDCKVPIGCPWGCDCPEDAFPDHHQDIQTP